MGIMVYIPAFVRVMQDLDHQPSRNLIKRPWALWVFMTYMLEFYHFLGGFLDQVPTLWCLP